MTKVSLCAMIGVVEDLAMQSGMDDDLISEGYYFDRTTNEIRTFDRDVLRELEDEGKQLSDYSPEEQVENKPTADFLEKSDRDETFSMDYDDFFDGNCGYDWRVAFADSLNNQALQRALNGRGAFKRFSDQLHREDLDDAWYAFQDQQQVKVAVDWLTDHDIDYVDDRTKK